MRFDELFKLKLSDLLDYLQVVFHTFYELFFDLGLYKITTYAQPVVTDIGTLSIGSLLLEKIIQYSW